MRYLLTTSLFTQFLLLSFEMVINEYNKFFFFIIQIIRQRIYNGILRNKEEKKVNQLVA